MGVLENHLRAVKGCGRSGAASSTSSVASVSILEVLIGQRGGSMVHRVVCPISLHSGSPSHGERKDFEQEGNNPKNYFTMSKMKVGDCTFCAATRQTGKVEPNFPALHLCLFV